VLVSNAAPANPARPSEPTPAIPADLRRRLEPMPARDWRSWVVALWVVAIAAILRFVKLGFPPELAFDEVYYVHEGQELLDHGVEWRYDYDDDRNITADRGADYVVHPPLGKWLIGLGIWLSRTWLSGDQPIYTSISSGPVGWRFTPAVFGVLSVLILTRTARRMFRSTILGATAGLLMALDGMHFVLSRTAILDIFLMFFILAAFACLILDRDHRRALWLRELEHGRNPTTGGKTARLPLTRHTIPWWRLAAGVLLGLGCGVKWSAIFFLPVFAALIYLWEANLRRTLGIPHPWRDALLDEGTWILTMAALVIPTYLATWTGWFATDTGWKRHYLLSQGRDEWPILGALYNLWAYHSEMLSFHTHLTSSHPYQSSPWQWLVLGRPVAIYWDTEPRCGAESCASEILLLGTPVLWWAFIPALIAMTWFGISRRDWRPLAIGASIAAGILPWFYYDIADHRTMYYFYALPAEPFLVLAVAYVLGCLINGRTRSPGRWLALTPQERRRTAIIGAAVFVALVAVCFWIYYPIYVGDSIPYEHWYRRMLLGRHWV